MRTIESPGQSRPIARVLVVLMTLGVVLAPAGGASAVPADAATVLGAMGWSGKGGFVHTTTGQPQACSADNVDQLEVDASPGNQWLLALTLLFSDLDAGTVWLCGSSSSSGPLGGCVATGMGRGVFGSGRTITIDHIAIAELGVLPGAVPPSITGTYHDSAGRSGTIAGTFYGQSLATMCTTSWHVPVGTLTFVSSL